MAVTYDERVIIEFAERLYRRATTIVTIYALLGGGLGALVVFGSGRYYASMSNWPRDLGGPAIVVALVGAVLGYAVGRERAFALRLTAQTALCQAQIERNTRAVAMGRVQPPPIPA